MLTNLASHPRFRRDRSGAIIVFLVLALAVFFAFMALVVDVGYHYARKAEIQIQADACALQALSKVVFVDEKRYSTTAQVNKTIAEEKVSIQAVIEKFVTANGYGSNYFSISYTLDTTDDDVDSLALDKVVPSSFFFATLLGIPSFNLGIHAKVSRNSADSPDPRDCAFYGKTNVQLGGTTGGTSDFAIDSFNSSSGSYESQSAHTDLNGNSYVRELATICSDAELKVNGKISQHGGLNTIGEITFSGTALDIYGNVITADSSNPDPDGSEVHATAYPSSNGTITVNANISELSLPAVDFTEACSLDRVVTYCPRPTVASNDNYLITGYFNSTSLAAGTLTNGTGAGTSDCSGGTNKKTICLPAGYTYYFYKIDINNTTDLKITGTNTTSKKTLIYVDTQGNCNTDVVKIAGQTDFGSSQYASNILFYVGSTTSGYPDACADDRKPTIKLTGGGSMAADLYAPGVKVDISGNVEYFGRIYANEIDKSGNGALHYDESLGYKGEADTTVQKHRVILVE